MPLPADFEQESLYAPEAWYVHDLVEIDVPAGRVVCRVDTTKLGPLVDAQRPHTGHTRHVPGAIMVQITGTLGNLHAVYVLGLRVSEGWVGFGTHVRNARFPGIGHIGPELLVRVDGVRVRTIREARFVEYGFRFEQEGRLIYESHQTAAWVRGEARG